MNNIIQEKIFEQYKKFKLNLAKEIKKYRKKKGVTGGSDEKGVADIITCVDFYYRKEHSESELKKIITDGDKDLSFIDAAVLLEDEVDIFDIKINGEKSILADIKIGFDNYLEHQPKDYSSVNKVLAPFLREIHKKHIKNFNLIFIREFSNKEAEEKFKKTYEHLSKRHSIKLKFFTRSELIQNRQGSFNIEDLVLEDTKLFEEKNKKINWAITVASLNKILEQYKNILDKDLLFFKNIRKPQEEKKLKDTLFRSLTNNAKTFHYRHNGIVMTSSSIKPEGNGLRVCSPQVVNGAQTLGVLFLIYEENKHLFKNAKIVVKILSVDDQESIDDICEAANTQKPVTTADLRTNDYLQKNLELYIGSLANGLYYYVRGKINPNIKKEKKKQHILIYKEDFIQWANSAFLKKPYESKNQKAKLFTEVYFGKQEEPYKQIEKALIENWEHIEVLCKIATSINYIIKELPKTKRNEARIMDQHIIASMYDFCLSEKKLDDFTLKKNFDKAFKKHTLAFKACKYKKGRNFKIRNYFISKESF